MKEKSDKTPGMRLSFDIGDAFEKPDMPLRLLIIGNFSGQAVVDQSTPLAVQTENLPQVLQRMPVKLEFEAVNVLVPGQKYLAINYRIIELADLSPAGIIAQVPALTECYLFVERLKLLMSNEMSPAEFLADLSAYESISALQEPIRLCQQAFHSAEPSASRETHVPISHSDDEAVDRILDMVELDQVSQPSISSNNTGLDQLIGDIAADSIKFKLPDKIKRALELTLAKVNDQLNMILHHAAFKQLEATWRGLTWLLNQTEANNHIQIEIINSHKAQLPEIFHEQVYQAELDGLLGCPASLVLINFEFNNSHHELQVLQGIGEQAEMLQIPVIFSVGADFFGLSEDGAAAEKIPMFYALFDKSQYVEWNALRRKECGRWLACVYNRFLLRDVYTPDNTRGLFFHETIAQHDDYLWGNGIWVVACLITNSFTDCTWPTEITGHQHGQVENMDLYELVHSDGPTVQIPLAVRLDEQQADDLVRYGFIPLTCQANRDSIYVLQAPTLHQATHYDKYQMTLIDRKMTSLPYQLLVSRIAQILVKEKDKILVGDDSQAILINVKRYLTSLLSSTGPGYRVDAEIKPSEDSDQQQLYLSLHTGRQVMNEVDVQLVLGIYS